MWPLLLTISTAALCLGLLSRILDFRGATEFVRPFHYGVAFATVVVAVGTFWPLLRRVVQFYRGGAFALSNIFTVCFFSIWLVTLPLGDALAIHYQRRNPAHLPVPADAMYGWFYMNDSGGGDHAMSIIDPLFFCYREPWWPIIFLAFYPCFFHLYRRSQTKKASQYLRAADR